MAVYEHICETCKHEWEAEYSIKADPPKNCPSCQAETVKRLISLGGNGVVLLQGDDLVAKVKSDAKKLEGEASRNEKVYSNLMGESAYEKLSQRLDKQNR